MVEKLKLSYFAQESSSVRGLAVSFNTLIDEVEGLKKDTNYLKSKESETFKKTMDLMSDELKKEMTTDQEPKIYDVWTCDRNHLCTYKQDCYCDIQIKTTKEYQEEYNCTPIKLQEVK